MNRWDRIQLQLDQIWGDLWFWWSFMLTRPMPPPPPPLTLDEFMLDESHGHHHGCDTDILSAIDNKLYELENDFDRHQDNLRYEQIDDILFGDDDHHHDDYGDVTDDVSGWDDHHHWHDLDDMNT